MKRSSMNGNALLAWSEIISLVRWFTNSHSKSSAPYSSAFPPREALSTPRLWSYFSVDVEKPNFPLLNHQIAHSGVVPLSVHLFPSGYGTKQGLASAKQALSLYLLFTADIATAWGSIDYLKIAPLLKELHFHCLDDGPSSSFQLRLATEYPRPRQVRLIPSIESALTGPMLTLQFDTGFFWHSNAPLRWRDSNTLFWCTRIPSRRAGSYYKCWILWYLSFEPIFWCWGNLLDFSTSKSLRWSSSLFKRSFSIKILFGTLLCGVYIQIF